MSLLHKRTKIILPGKKLLKYSAHHEIILLKIVFDENLVMCFRSSIAQIGEFLKMKTVIPVLADGTSVIATGSNMGEDDDSKVMREVVHICGRCYKTFDHQDDLVNHACMNNMSLTQQSAAPLPTISSPLATAGAQSAKKNRSGSSKPGSNETQQGGPFPCQTCGKVKKHFTLLISLQLF